MERAAGVEPASSAWKAEASSRYTTPAFTNIYEFPAVRIDNFRKEGIPT